ncbi:MAG: 6-hydroxymethylpterin diphosphokinase MptE-like protein [Candidatus Bathyarchaeia archaeon]
MTSSRAVTLDLWMPWYQKIAEMLRLDRGRDEEATRILSALLEGRDTRPAALEERLKGRPVLVFGAGPSLERNLREVDLPRLSSDWVVVAADGATTALTRFGKRMPDIIVTDLDGWMPDILAAHSQGAAVVVHGHGDNIRQLRRYVPLLGSALGTTQVEPQPRVYNLGGFTDGDRAVFLAYAMRAETIALAGMDLGTVIGRYSKRRVRSVEAKLTKLRICKELLEWLASRAEARLLNATWYGEKIRGFRDVQGGQLRDL